MSGETEDEYRSAWKLAERLAGHAADQISAYPERAALLAATAQVHATLALAAATKLGAAGPEDE